MHIVKINYNLKNVKSIKSLIERQKSKIYKNKSDILWYWQLNLQFIFTIDIDI